MSGYLSSVASVVGYGASAVGYGTLSLTKAVVGGAYTIASNALQPTQPEVELKKQRIASLRKQYEVIPAKKIQIKKIEYSESVRRALKRAEKLPIPSKEEIAKVREKYLGGGSVAPLIRQKAATKSTRPKTKALSQENLSDKSSQEPKKNQKKGKTIPVSEVRANQFITYKNEAILKKIGENKYSLKVGNIKSNTVTEKRDPIKSTHEGYEIIFETKTKLQEQTIPIPDSSFLKNESTNRMSFLTKIFNNLKIKVTFSISSFSKVIKGDEVETEIGVRDEKSGLLTIGHYTNKNAKEYKYELRHLSPNLNKDNELQGFIWFYKEIGDRKKALIQNGYFDRDTLQFLRPVEKVEKHGTADEKTGNLVKGLYIVKQEDGKHKMQFRHLAVNKKNDNELQGHIIFYKDLTMKREETAFDGYFDRKTLKFLRKASVSFRPH